MLPGIFRCNNALTPYVIMELYKGEMAVPFYGTNIVINSDILDVREVGICDGLSGNLVSSDE